jgi:hypothetical protein
VAAVPESLELPGARRSKKDSSRCPGREYHPAHWSQTPAPDCEGGSSLVQRCVASVWHFLLVASHLRTTGLCVAQLFQTKSVRVRAAWWTLGRGLTADKESAF